MRPGIVSDFSPELNQKPYEISVILSQPKGGERITSDYRYSKDIVYNNFPWPTPTDAHKEKIEKTAQAILDARNL